MNIRKMPLDELELYSFTDIAYHIIKEDKETKLTAPLFKEICSLLNLSETQYVEKISDFFTSLTTDKRFILLNSKDWDLKENHSITIASFDNDEDIDDIEEDIDEESDSENEDEEEDIDDISDDIEEDIDEELDNLEIVDEDSELEE